MNFKCNFCEHVTGSDAGMVNHLRRKHGVEKDFAGNCQKTDVEPTNKYKRRSVSGKVNKAKKALRPEVTYVDVPIVLGKVKLGQG